MSKPYYRYVKADDLRLNDMFVSAFKMVNGQYPAARQIVGIRAGRMKEHEMLSITLLGGHNFKIHQEALVVVEEVA